MSNCSAYWNFLFTARIPRCPVRLSRPQLPVPPALHSQELCPAPLQCFAACQRAGRLIGSAVKTGNANTEPPHKCVEVFSCAWRQKYSNIMLRFS